MAKKGKLKGKKKAAFLARMKKGRLAKAAKKLSKKVRKRRSKPKSNKKRRKSQPIRTAKKRSPSVAKKKRSVSRSRGIFDKITKNKFVKGAALGLGGGALAIQISERFAPQFSGIAQPLGAFVFGGPIGLVASVLLQGGLGFLTGGSTNGGSTTSARDSL